MESESSKELAVSTLSCIDSIAPFKNSISSVRQGQDTSLVIIWHAGRDNESGVFGYNIYRDTISTPLNLTPVTALTFTDSSTRFSTTYEYFVPVVDNQGNESGKSQGKSERTRFCFIYNPPLVPANVRIEPIGQSSIKLKWSNSFDPGSANIVFYNVYLNGNAKPINSPQWRPNEFTVLDLPCDSSYSFTLSTYDMWGNESDTSIAVVYDQTCPELITPSVP